MSNIHLELLQLAQDKDSDANPTYLLNQGANPNYRDRDNHKWTPLHYSVFLNKENFALALLSHPRTNSLLLDSDGFSALYWAAKKSTPRIISALLSKGSDPNQCDVRGMTALFAAVTSGKIENVKQLISHPSINVNQVNQFGGSALHHTAFATDNIEIANILVCKGANLWLIDKENQYPLHVAKRRKRANLFKYFKTKMLLQKPYWKCPINFKDEPNVIIDSDETSVAEDDEKLTQIMPAQSVTDNINISNDKSNNSTDSGFSRQSSDDNEELNINISPKQARYNSEPLARIKKMKNSKKYKKKMKLYSCNSQSSPGKRDVKYKQKYIGMSMSHQSHENKMKQLQENKFQMALKIEQANLNDEARELLQEQQIYFQYEQEVFYTATQQQFSDFRREIESMKHQMKELKHENMKLIQQNTDLQHKHIKLNMQLAYQSGHQRYGNNKNKIYNYNKYTKEFKNWFKKEIGLMEYFSCFIENGFDDLKTIRHITNENELKQLGIDKMGHRLHILHVINKYRNKYENIAQPAFTDCVSSPINKSIIENSIDYIEGSNNDTGY